MDACCTAWNALIQQPHQITYLVPGSPGQWIDTRPDCHRVIHTCDVNVQPDGLMFVNDYNAGPCGLQ